MATLVLTAVGTLVGGPVGGAVGALVGQAIDTTLLAPAGRQGPRLGDLAVQTSAYGTALPKIFGRMRVAGTVIWATDLRETRNRSGGGKGQPATTSYAYSASFAVALSGRPLRSVGRIWADGNLLRGAAGDWKATTGFRFHAGGEDQPVDPLIAAALGDSSAFRGIGYVVFEDLALADYGNRIPSLSFEVEADPTPPTIGAIAAALADGAVGDATTTTVIGYAASGDSVRGAIAALAAAGAAVLVDDGARLLLSEDAGAALIFADDDLGAAAGASGGVRRAIDRRAAGTLPDRVTLSYYEVERDFQTGLQQASRGGPGRRTLAVELAAVLAAADAKRIAERRLAADWAARREAVVRLPWRWLAVAPGRAAALAGLPDGWRVTRVTLDAMVAELTLVGIDGGAAGPVPAAPGHAVAQPDLPHGPTTLRLFELPPVDDGAESVPRLLIAAAGASAGWRQALLERSLDGGQTLETIGRTAPPATLGTVSGVLAAAGTALFDLATTLEVRLLDPAMTLAGCSDAALFAGANLALAGGELLQFGEVEQIGIARFRLRRLLRGRRGTEAAVAAHGPDEGFVLVAADTLAATALPLAMIGRELLVSAQGIGDPIPVEARATLAAPALRPPAPVHLRAERAAGGGLTLGWIRRSRTGWDWADGVDAPLGEEAERYRLSIAGPGTTRIVETGEPRWFYSPADQALDGTAGAATLAISVVQLGTIAPSPAAHALLAL